MYMLRVTHSCAMEKIQGLNSMMFNRSHMHKAGQLLARTCPCGPITGFLASRSTDDYEYN